MIDIDRTDTARVMAGIDTAGDIESPTSERDLLRGLDTAQGPDALDTNMVMNMVKNDQNVSRVNLELDEFQEGDVELEINRESVTIGSELKKNSNSNGLGRYQSAGTVDTLVDDMEIIQDLDLDTPKSRHPSTHPSMQEHMSSEDNLLQKAISPMGHQQIDDPFGARDVED